MKNIRLLVVAMTLAGGVAGYLWLGRTPAPSEPQPAAAAADSAAMSDDERRAYVAAHVKLHQTVVSADTRKTANGETLTVAGLLLVSGKVENMGDKPVSMIEYRFNPLDESGAVVASYPENILGGVTLAPGAVHTFQFTIPDRKEFSGKFAETLK